MKRGNQCVHKGKISRTEGVGMGVRRGYRKVTIGK